MTSCSIPSFVSCINRLQSCETTFEHLERYTAMTQVNHTWMEAMSETVSKMPPVENGVQAKAQLDSTAVYQNHFIIITLEYGI